MQPRCLCQHSKRPQTVQIEVHPNPSWSEIQTVLLILYLGELAIFASPWLLGFKHPWSEPKVLEDNTHKHTMWLNLPMQRNPLPAKHPLLASHGKEAKEVQAILNLVFLRAYKSHLQLLVFIPRYASSMASLDALCDRIPQWSTRELDKWGWDVEILCLFNLTMHSSLFCLATCLNASIVFTV